MDWIKLCVHVVCALFGADCLVAVLNDIKRARHCLQVGACVIYSKLRQVHMDSGSDELALVAGQQKQDKCVFIGNWSSNLWSICLSSYDLFERATHYILHRYVNSYGGTLPWTTITMLDGSQFTSMICWFHLKTRRNYISFSWMDISPSRKLIVSFRLWD